MCEEIFAGEKISKYLMGPSGFRILQELLGKVPLQIAEKEPILDLGCGKGVTSLVLARETEATVYADDLWISAEENAQRFAEWGVSDRVIPVHEDANALSFPKPFFRAMVSVDAYHYFAGKCGFFEEKILPFLCDGAIVLIGVPGVKKEYTGRASELLAEWLGEDAHMFKSVVEWEQIIGNHERIKSVETWEMDCFETAWEEWFATGISYAVGDKAFYEKLIQPYTCFVGICIRLK